MKNKNKRISLFGQSAGNRTIAQEDDHQQETPEYNDYYLSVSIKFRLAKIVCVFTLCVFILSSILVFGESLTYDNARYVLRDLGQILSEDSSLHSEKIAFEVKGDSDYSFYRGSIVIAGVSGVDIYSPSGTLKLRDKTAFTSPAIATSDKYCIVYSTEAYNLSVYNTVTRVYDMKFDYPIYDVDVSDNGYIAVMTNSKEYKSVVYYYDADFRLVATYNKNTYPVSVDIDDKDDELKIATFGTENGKYYTEIKSYTPKSDSEILSVRIDDALPYDIVSTENENTVLAFGHGLIFLSDDGTVISERTTKDVISGYHFSNGAYSYSILQTKHTRMQTFDEDGNVLRDLSDNEALNGYSFDEYSVFKNKNELHIYDSDMLNQTIEIGTGVKKILYHEGYIYLCYPDLIIPAAIG